MATNKSGENVDAVPTSSSIKIHILCPSISPTSRFTLPGLSLNDTVASLRRRIQVAIPTHPSPTDQRLIFRGRHFTATADPSSLREVLAPIDGNEYTVHLVLPPSPASTVPASQTPAFPFAPSNLSSTIPASTSAMPAEPSFSFNNTSVAPPSQADLRRRVMQSNIGHTPNATDQLHHQRQSSSSDHFNSHASTNLTSSIYNNDWVPPRRSHQPQPNNSSSSTEFLQDFRNRFNLPNPEASSSTSTGFNMGTIETSHLQFGGSSHVGSETRPSAIELATRSATDDVSSSEILAILREFLRLSSQIDEIELQMISGPLPSAEALFRLSSRLFQIQEELQRIPSSRYSSSIFSMAEFERQQGRILQIFQQHDNMTRGLLSQRPNSLNAPLNPSNEVPRVYLATSPSGTQGLVVSLGTSGPATPGVGHSANPPANPVSASPFNGPNAALEGAQPNQADVQNVVRQALVNHQRQNEAADGGAGRHIRRIWLFVRLYFFIYMISESGTWTRILYVTIAVLVSLLSDSELPQQLLRMLVTPMQRHLERLALVGGPAEPPDARPRAVVGDVLDYLWRAERSLVLLLASLIPGIGERQVQARSTAEAESEQRRVEEERRQSEEENRRSEGEGQNEPERQQEQEQQQEQQGQSQVPPQLTGESQPQPTIPA